MNLEELGFSREELMDRAVSAIIEKMLYEPVYNEFGNEDIAPNSFQRELEKRIKQGVDEKISDMAERTVIPMLNQRIEDTVMQKTNEWGEAKGEPLTFQEYLVDRAASYLTEPVNHEGKAKHENGAYSWSKSTTRVVHLIEKHLKHNIDSAMKKALEEANKSIVGGINEAVRISLSKMSEKMGVELKVKR